MYDKKRQNYLERSAAMAWLITGRDFLVNSGKFIGNAKGINRKENKTNLPPPHPRA